MNRFFQAADTPFDDLWAGFRWNIPERFNIARAVCDRHRDIADRVAVICENADGEQSRYCLLYTSPSPRDHG